MLRFIYFIFPKVNKHSEVMFNSLPANNNAENVTKKKKVNS